MMEEEQETEELGRSSEAELQEEAMMPSTAALEHPELMPTTNSLEDQTNRSLIEERSVTEEADNEGNQSIDVNLVQEDSSAPDRQVDEGLTMMEVENSDMNRVTEKALAVELEDSKAVGITAIDIGIVEASNINGLKVASEQEVGGTVGSTEIEDVQVAETEQQTSEKKADDNSDAMEEEDTGETVAVTDSGYYFWPYQLPSEFTPRCLITSAESEFHQLDKEKKTARYVKGCKWAPDGSCLISCADDDSLRLFNFPTCFSSVTDWTSDDQPSDQVDNQEWLSALKIKEGGLIYDYCWYPLMSSMDPVSSCFLSTSSEAPIHLWDAFSGKLRATYTPYNHLDQVISAYSLAFDPTGQTIYSGFEKSIRVFNITRPGRECTLRPLKQQLYELNQYGIIASIAVNPSMSSFYAVGSFDKTIGLYYEDGSVICLLQGHAGGITNMKFSSDGLKLFTGGRRDSRLICWDMRKMGEAYKIYDRVVSTHQRIYFDLDPSNRYLVSGGTDGIVKVWDLLSEDSEPVCTFRCNSDCVNGVSLNPYVPLLATSSGQRHFLEVDEDSDEDELFTKSKASQERSCDIKLWKFT